MLLAAILPGNTLGSMTPEQKQADPTMSRSPSAVALLEQLQSHAGHRSGDERTPEDDPRILREIARKALLQERLDAITDASLEQIADASVAIVGEPSFEADVEARAQEMERHYAQPDGDLWSRHERPDRRLRLAELVMRVERGAGTAGYRIPRRPVVGTLPTYELNAKAIPGPSGEGHLVVFDSGMFRYSATLGWIAAQALNATEDEKAYELDPGAIHRVPGCFLALARQWADLLFCQAVLETCVYTEIVRVAPQHAAFAERLTQAVDTFALAHEYGHVILGHVDIPGVGRALDPQAAHAQEFAADAVGLEICTAAWGDPWWACLGACAFFFGGEAVELATNSFRTGTPQGGASPSHPSSAARRRAITERLVAAGDGPNRVSKAMYDALGQLTGFSLPAFAEAYRAGVPESGYRPPDEYAKQAVFRAFWYATVALHNEGKS